jgi:hypothetical protein
MSHFPPFPDSAESGGLCSLLAQCSLLTSSCPISKPQKKRFQMASERKSSKKWPAPLCRAGALVTFNTNTPKRPPHPPPPPPPHGPHHTTVTTPPHRFNQVCSPSRTQAAPLPSPPLLIIFELRRASCLVWCHSSTAVCNILWLVGLPVMTRRRPA